MGAREGSISPRSAPAPKRGGRSALVTGLVVVAALLPVALLSLISYRLAAKRMLDLVSSSNATAADMTAELVRSDLARNIDMARALAAQPAMVGAVQGRNADGVRECLKATVDAVNRKQAGAGRAAGEDAARLIDRAYVTDPRGTEWSDYPHVPEAIGRNFSDRDWYRGVTQRWEPYLSEVYVRLTRPQILIVSMAAPVRDPAGKVIGILVLQMPVGYLSNTLKNVRVGGGSGYVYVVDRNGAVAAHPLLADLQSHRYTEPFNSTPVYRALTNRPSEGDYDDPITKTRMVAAFRTVAVPDGTWAVVAQQPADEVYGPIRRLGISIAIAGSLVAVAAFLLVASLRRASVRDRKLSDALEAKRAHLASLAAELENTAGAEKQARIAAQAAHDELRKAQGRLVQSEKLAALGQLVAGVAHEINNPLAFVLNNVAVLQRDLKSLEELIRLYQRGDGVLERELPEVMDQIRALCDHIDLAYTMTEITELPVRTREGLSRIQQIVKDLRDFARQNAIGDIQPGADLNSGIESTLNIARGTARKHKVEFTFDPHPLPGVTCSPGKINQVVLNLITNAVQASPDGGRVTVRTRHIKDGVQIQVADNGTGIPPEIRDRIFDPFFTTKPQGEGTGLGLSISHGIVSDHGGRLEVESEVGVGTTFTVTLPLCPPSVAAENPAPRRSAGVDGPAVAAVVG
jgi:signal transduction histidine kinase